MCFVFTELSWTKSGCRILQNLYGDLKKSEVTVWPAAKKVPAGKTVETPHSAVVIPFQKRT